MKHQVLEQSTVYSYGNTVLSMLLSIDDKVGSEVSNNIAPAPL